MGVDFYACVKCSDTFPDCGEYVSCDCGQVWCSDVCANKDGYNSDDEGESYCNYCTGKDTEDYELVDFLLKHFKITREEAVKLYYKDRKCGK